MFVESDVVVDDEYSKLVMIGNVLLLLVDFVVRGARPVIHASQKHDAAVNNNKRARILCC